MAYTRMVQDAAIIGGKKWELFLKGHKVAHEERVDKERFIAEENGAEFKAPAYEMPKRGIGYKFPEVDDRAIKSAGDFNAAIMEFREAADKACEEIAEKIELHLGKAYMPRLATSELFSDAAIRTYGFKGCTNKLRSLVVRAYEAFLGIGGKGTEYDLL